MAKNLKINIKNTQIAQVLKLKEPSVPKTKKATPKKLAKVKPQEEAPKPKVRIVEAEKALPPAPAIIEEAIVQPSPVEEVKVEEVKVEEPKVVVEEPKIIEKPKEEVVKEEVAEEEKKATTFKEFKEFKNLRRAETQKFDTRARMGLTDFDEERWRKKRFHKQKRAVVEEKVIRPKELKVKLPITIKDLASAMKLKASELISKLFMQGIVVTINDVLDDETTVQLLGHDFECAITIDTDEESRLRITDKSIKEEITQTPLETLKARPPIVTFMGHVDHGKTSLIDAIRSSNLVAGEAGAITQHIGAFYTKTASGTITILDTPGHEAFQEMRSRGALVTDIIVLVVAGDEGFKEQTLEAINQAKTASLPIVVAINKKDKPGFDAEKVYRQLADVNLLPEIWGGTTITVNCSALKKEGIKELLEMVLLQAEVLELKANPDTRARGTIIESEKHKGLGIVATALVQNGTLHRGDSIVFGDQWGKIKTMYDQWDKIIEEAPPSMPVKITGISDLAEAGSEFIVVNNEKEAKDLAEARKEVLRTNLLKQSKKTLDLLQESVKKKVLPLILRADVQGSLEALKASLLKIESKKVLLNIISEGVGEISESDVQLAAASKATIIGFHTKVESHAEDIVKQLNVTVKEHNIIYHLIDEVKALMISLLDKIEEETERGSAIVKALFKSSQVGIIIGCSVQEGTIARSHRIKVIRGKEVIWQGQIISLKKVKEDVREVQKGMECGILLDNCFDVQEGDILKAFEITYLTQDL